jgi:hypothetical protein
VRRGDEEADDGEVDTKQKQRAAWGELEIPDYDEYAIMPIMTIIMHMSIMTITIMIMMMIIMIMLIMMII